MTTPTLKNKSHSPTLLVVDDDILVLATLASGLRDAGYHVIQASSGEEAIELSNQFDVDLAILDIRMPGISGIELAKILYENKSIPFLFLSAFSDTATVSEAINEGALGYLIKPIDVGNIIPTIETALIRSSEISSLKSAEKNLATALNLDRDISIAIGIITANSNCNANEAEQAMRKYARSNRIKMHDIAVKIIDLSDQLTLLIGEITKYKP